MISVITRKRRKKKVVEVEGDSLWGVEFRSRSVLVSWSFGFLPLCTEGPFSFVIGDRPA